MNLLRRLATALYKWHMARCRRFDRKILFPEILRRASCFEEGLLAIELRISTDRAWQIAPKEEVKSAKSWGELWKLYKEIRGLRVLPRSGVGEKREKGA